MRKHSLKYLGAEVDILQLWILQEEMVKLFQVQADLHPDGLQMARLDDIVMSCVKKYTGSYFIYWRRHSH